VAQDVIAAPLPASRSRSRAGRPPRPTENPFLKRPLLAILVSIATVAIGMASGYAADRVAAVRAVPLSPDLLEPLRPEMRAIAAEFQGMALSLATADWQAVQDASAKIRASHLPSAKLTPAQATELEQALPEPSRRLDAEFHERAQRIEAAAAARDPALSAFH
jgi:hypothetical protein